MGDLAARIGLIEEYDRLLQQRQDLVREREFVRAKANERAANLGVDDSTEWVRRDADSRDEAIQALHASSRTDIVDVSGGLEEADRQVRKPVTDEERERRTEALRKLVAATEEFTTLDDRIRRVDQRLTELEEAGVARHRPPSDEAAAELDRMARERAEELRRIKPRRGMRDDLAVRLGVVDDSGNPDEAALGPARREETIAALRAQAQDELRNGALRVDELPARLLQIDGLADAADDVNRAHNRIGRLQDEMARAAGVWRRLVEAEGGRMVTDRVGIVEGERPRIIVLGPRSDPAAPRADHDRALADALRRDAAVAQAFVREETTVEYRQVLADREGSARTADMTPPEVEHLSSGWHDGRRLHMTAWRDAEGNLHPVDPTRPTWTTNRDGGTLPKKYKTKDLPDGVSGWAMEDVVNDITLPTDDVPPGQIPESSLPVHMPQAPSQYDTSHLPRGMDVFSQHWGADSYNIVRLILMAALVPNHPAVKAWIQRHPEIGEWVLARPWLQKIPPFGTVFRDYEWFAPPERNIQPMHRPWDPAEHGNPADRVEIPESLQREWDDDVADWRRVQEWADSEYDRFLADDSDVDRIVEGLEAYRRARQEAAARDVVDIVRDELITRDPGINPLLDVDAQLLHMQDSIDRVAGELADRFASDDLDAVRDTVEDIRELLHFGTDPDAIAAVLAEHMRDDVPVFTRDQLQQIKNHLMVDEHRVRDYTDPNGAYLRRPMDRLADVAEAWHRLMAGEPLPQDLVLLHDALAESEFLRANPSAGWREANMHAIGLGYHWDADRPPLTGWRAGIPYAVHPVAPNPAWLPPGSGTDGPELPPPDGPRPAVNPPRPDAPGSGGVRRPEPADPAESPESATGRHETSPDEPPAPAHPNELPGSGADRLDAGSGEPPESTTDGRDAETGELPESATGTRESESGVLPESSTGRRDDASDVPTPSAGEPGDVRVWPPESRRTPGQPEPTDASESSAGRREGASGAPEQIGGAPGEVQGRLPETGQTRDRSGSFDGPEVNAGGGAQKPPGEPPAPPSSPEDGPSRPDRLPGEPSDWFLRMQIEQAEWNARMAAEHAQWLHELAEQPLPPDATIVDEMRQFAARMRAENADMAARVAQQRVQELRDLAAARRTAEPEAGAPEPESPAAHRDSSAGPPRSDDRPASPDDWFERMRVEQAEWEARMDAERAEWLRGLSDRDPEDSWARLQAEQAEWEARMGAERAAWLREMAGPESANQVERRGATHESEAGTAERATESRSAAQPGEAATPPRSDRSESEAEPPDSGSAGLRPDTSRADADGASLKQEGAAPARPDAQQPRPGEQAQDETVRPQARDAEEHSSRQRDSASQGNGEPGDVRVWPPQPGQTPEQPGSADAPEANAEGGSQNPPDQPPSPPRPDEPEEPGSRGWRRDGPSRTHEPVTPELRDALPALQDRIAQAAAARRALARSIADRARQIGLRTEGMTPHEISRAVDERMQAEIARAEALRNRENVPSGEMVQYFDDLRAAERRVADLTTFVRAIRSDLNRYHRAVAEENNAWTEAGILAARDVLAAEGARMVAEGVGVLPDGQRVMVASPLAEPDPVLAPETRRQLADQGVRIDYRLVTVDENGVHVTTLRPPEEGGRLRRRHQTGLVPAPRRGIRVRPSRRPDSRVPRPSRAGPSRFAQTRSRPRHRRNSNALAPSVRKRSRAARSCTLGVISAPSGSRWTPRPTSPPTGSTRRWRNCAARPCGSTKCRAGTPRSMRWKTPRGPATTRTSASPDWTSRSRPPAWRERRKASTTRCCVSVPPSPRSASSGGRSGTTGSPASTPPAAQSTTRTWR